MGRAMALLNILVVPIILLNLVGGIGSGIWLAILGDWGSIMWGVIFLFLAPFAVSLLLMPSILLGGPGLFFMEKGWTIPAYFFILLSTLYTTVVIVVWCIGILYFFGIRATYNTDIPLLIWSYGVATGVWTFLAQKDAQTGAGEASITSAFFAQVGYIVVMVMVYFHQATLAGLAIAFGAVMAIPLIFNFVVAVISQREMQLQSRK